MTTEWRAGFLIGSIAMAVGVMLGGLVMMALLL